MEGANYKAEISTCTSDIKIKTQTLLKNIESPQENPGHLYLRHFTSQEFELLMRSCCVDSSSPQKSAIPRNTRWSSYFEK